MNLRKLIAFSAALMIICTGLCACAQEEAYNPSMQNVVDPTDPPTEAETEAETTELETTEPETEPETEEIAVYDDGWRESYLDVIDRLPDENNVSQAGFNGALLYIDNDDIPEMYYGFDITGGVICGGIYTYRNGSAELIYAVDNWEGYLCHKERGGIFASHGYDESKNEFVKFMTMDSTQPMETFMIEYDGASYQHNGSKVTEAEYNQLLNAAESGYIFADIVKVDDLKKIINTGEVSTSGNASVVPDSNTSPGGLEITPAGLKMTFSDILAQTDSSTEGFLCDLDLDGKEEMILISDAEKGFILYRYNSSGSVEEYHFGKLTNAFADVFEATGTDGSHYLYYRDEKNHISRQGYFDVVNNNELRIVIDYPNISTANWTIYHNDTEYDSSYETVDGVYAQPDKCHTSLLNAFSDCGFALVENSKYSRVTCLSYSELCSRVQ